jgi:Mrp family chromosome partitioning ATPase
MLELVQEDRELFHTPPVTQSVPAYGTPARMSLPDPGVFTREEVLRLVQRLFLANGRKGNTGPRRVVFCGIDEAEGGNLLCARVGRSLAEQVHSEICVVDANARVSIANPMFDVSPLDSSALPESTTMRKRLQRVTANLWLVPNKSVTVNGATPSLDQMRAFIKDLCQEFTYVLISAPPVGSYSDAVLLGQGVDGVVLVLEANSTRRVAALKAKRALEAAEVRVLGTVLNNRTFPIPEKIYRLL